VFSQGKDLHFDLHFGHNNYLNEAHNYQIKIASAIVDAFHLDMPLGTTNV